MLGSVYYCCGKIPGQIDGRSGKNTSGCIEGFWRLAIKRIRGFSLAKTAESLRKNQLARSLMCFFHGSPSRFLLFITLTPQILLLGYLLTKVSIFYILNIHFFLVWYPSGKGLVCKTIIGRFDSYPHLLWRVPAIPQDAEGLGKLSAYFCKKFLISQA